ncbi:MAG: hypothetical protein ACKOBG_09735 [Actinomycetota bacterium]
MLGELLRWVSMSGLRRGLAGSKPWIIVAIVAIGARTIGRLAREPEPVLYRTVIQPGDVLGVSARRSGDTP